MTAPAGPVIGSFVALGDSFTEGLNDPGPAGGYRGWADRFAELLAVGHLSGQASTAGSTTGPPFRYANLAVRGKMLGEVVRQQLPAALSMAPDLVSIAAGGNDLLRPGADPDTLAAVFDDAVAKLRTAGSQVLVLTGFDPRTFPVIRWIRGKVAVYNMHLRGIADRHGCTVVDLWSMPVLCDPRVWSDDRLHLTAEGHRRVTLRACEAIGLPTGAGHWNDPLPPPPAALAQPARGAVGARAARGAVGARAMASTWSAARRVDVRWARDHAMPWVHRRIRGVSSGDNILPKRPDLLPLDALLPIDS
jgi:lysophospholipase L1-like esterase